MGREQRESSSGGTQGGVTRLEFTYLCMHPPITTGFGLLEANLLCEYVWWKLARHAGEIKQLFQTSGFDGQHDLVRV